MFDSSETRGALRLVASPDGGDGSLTIHQDARLYLAELEEARRIEHPLEPGRHAWLQVLRGEAELNGHALSAGDGVAVSEESRLAIAGAPGSKVLLFELA